ncbi:MAG: SAM-dependent DNA methyltransferase, partial [Thermomicrobiales bacterium]
WRNKDHTYADEPGFSKAAKLADVREHGHVLTPGRYVGTADAEDDGVPFAEKFEALQEQLQMQFAEGRTLEERIERALDGLKIDG